MKINHATFTAAKAIRIENKVITTNNNCQLYCWIVLLRTLKLFLGVAIEVVVFIFYKV